MRTNKLLLGLFAAGAIFASCSNDDDLAGGGGGVNAENAVSYLAVNLNMATPAGTRGTSDNSQAQTPDNWYEEGLDAENAVTDITFFFFSANGAAYAVNGTNSYLVETYETTGKNMPNVEEIGKSVLVIEESQGVPPAQMLAVVNAPAAVKANHSLAELQALLGEYNTNNGSFIMANSAYKNETSGELVYTTQISNSNLCTTSEAALAAPVDIYVERTAVKVRASLSEELAEGAVEVDGVTYFKTGNETANGVAIYAKIQGWQVTNLVDKAYLIKSLSDDWTNDGLGLTWNDQPYFRSYWANTSTGVNLSHPHKFTDITLPLVDGENSDNYTYCYENTLATNVENPNYATTESYAATQTGVNLATQLVVAASFHTLASAEDEDGNTTYTVSDVAIAEWYGVKYTIDDLKKAIVEGINDIYYTTSTEDGNGGTITTTYSLKDTDIEFVQNDDTKADDRYLVTVKLTADAEKYTFTNNLTAEQVNAKLAEIQPAKLWGNEVTVEGAKTVVGGGYYFLPIEHYGTDNSTAEYGVVRNHIYDYTISGVSGLGTPVYNPEERITPELPETSESFLAARLNILSWHIVNHDNIVLQ